MEELVIKLLINGFGLATEVHPVFGDDVKIKIDREENQIFRREKIEGTFQFSGDDFALIYGCSVYTTFTLQIFRSDTLVGSADFIRTDCEFNLDDSICKVKLTTKDAYEKLLNAYDNKYNLVKLSPVRETVTMQKRAIIQFYVRGENVVTNVVGGVSYEQSCAEVTSEDDLRNKYRFGGYLPLAYIKITSRAATSLVGITGRYVLKGNNILSIIYENEENSRFQILFTYELGLRIFSLYDTTTGTTLATVKMNSITIGAQPITFNTTDGAVYARGTFYSDGELYFRLLLPTKPEGAYDRSMDADISPYDSNYPYVKPLLGTEFTALFVANPNKTNKPTEWGIDSEGGYFQYPNLTPTQKAAGVSPIPIGQSHWERMSSWILYDDSISAMISQYSDGFELRDSYPLWSAIKVLLQKVDSTITFGNSPEYSEFLFGNGDSLLNEYLLSYNFPSSRREIYITPITNVKKTFYEQAAQKGDISLKQILDMLRNFYQCYWWIDADKRLRIEHIIYFKNGNTYQSEKPVIGIDITNKGNLPTKESWGFSQNTISFDVAACASRYEFQWGDSATYPFVGEPIDVTDKYLDSSKKESVSVDNFISDIDYILTNGTNIGNDLFAVYEASRGARFVKPFDVRLDGESPKYNIQNAYMSFLFAELFYYPFDLSGWRAKAGDATLDVFRTKGIVKQDVSCPLTIDEMRTIGAIRTELGVGIIDKMEVEADTLYAKNTILYEQGENVADKIYFYDFSAVRGIVNFYNPTIKPVRVRIGVLEDGVIQSETSLIIPLKGNITWASTKSPVILGVEDLSAFKIDRRFRKAEGAMTFDDGKSANGKYLLEINGNNYEADDDYAGIHITANEYIKITLSASIAAAYSRAYIHPTRPCCTTAEGASVAIFGVDSSQITLSAGDECYIGYMKDSAAQGNEDKVTITIEQV